MRPLILVVDDDPSICILRHLLQPCGYRILPSSDGHDALAKLAQEPVDLILLDVMMPTLSASTSAAACASSTQDKLPVLLLTASTSQGDRGGLQRRGQRLSGETLLQGGAVRPGQALLEASAGRASLVENRLLKQEIEHRLLLRSSCIRIRSGCWPCSAGADPIVFIDGQGRGAVRLPGAGPPAGPEPGNHGGATAGRVAGQPAGQPVADMAAHRQGFELPGGGPEDALNARALPINLGGQHAYTLTLSTEQPDDNRVMALENALKSLSRQAIIEDGHLLGN